MAAAPSDGLTLGLRMSPQAQALTIERQARFGLRHFAWIGTVFEDPSGLFVAPSSPIRSVPDVLQAAREAGDGLTAGTNDSDEESDPGERRSVKTKEQKRAEAEERQARSKARRPALCCT